MMELNKIYCGDNLTLIKQLDDLGVYIGEEDVNHGKN